MSQFTETQLHEARSEERRRRTYVAPSTFERIKKYFRPDVKSALGKYTYFASRDIGLDGSDYQPKVNWDALRGRMKFVIWKAAEVPDSWKTYDPANWIQKTFADACDKCYSNDIPFSGYIYLNPAYFWVNGGTEQSWLNIDDETDPVIWAKNVLKTDLNVYITVRSWIIGTGLGDWVLDPNLLKKAYYKKVYSWWGDAERWYRSTSDWLTNGNSATRVGSVWINNMFGRWAYRMTRLMRHGFIPTVPVGFYSAKWFIDTYCKEFDLSTAQNYPVWNAGWYWNPSPSVVTTLEGVKDQFTTIPDEWRPKMWGKDPTDIIQVSGDRFKIPEITNLNGVPVGTDWNVWWNPGQTLHQFLKYSSKPQECPTGSHWDDVQKICVPDDVPGPSTDLEKRVQALEEFRLEAQRNMEELNKTATSLRDSVHSAGDSLKSA